MIIKYYYGSERNKLHWIKFWNSKPDPNKKTCTNLQGSDNCTRIVLCFSFIRLVVRSFQRKLYMITWTYVLLFFALENKNIIIPQKQG